MESDDDYLYVTGNEYFAVYAVDNLLPEELASFEIPLYYGKDLVVDENYAYLGNMHFGITILDVSDPGSITHHSSAFTGTSVKNIEVGHYIYVSDYAGGIYLFEKGGAISIAEGNKIQNEIILDQNFPNPFRAVTNINYYLPAKSYIEIALLNQQGREIMILAKGFQSSGKHTLVADLSGLAPGIYYYRMQCGDEVQTKKCIIRH